MTTENGAELRDAVRERLDPFFTANSLAVYQMKDGKRRVQTPWGDDSIALNIPEWPDSLIDALNAVYLPPQFSALWHQDSKDLEFLWTVVPVKLELRRRSFEFRFKDKQFRCEFGSSSDRLLSIAECSEPVKPPTRTNHRNLSEFYLYMHSRKQHGAGDASEAAPTSFWVRGIELDENATIEFAYHLNFYMVYFDSYSPRIMIHEPLSESLTGIKHVTPGAAAFPAVIAARTLNPYLLLLRNSVLEASDIFMKFVYAYQVLEYAAFYYLQESVAQTIKRLLLAPDSPARVTETSRQILDVITDSRMQDEAKLTAVVKQLVDPMKIWPNVDFNREYFSGPIKFDGGFALDALIKKEWTADDFKSAWHPKVCDSLRMIRNNVVHAREARQAKGIAPTLANVERLRPWVHLIGSVADEVILSIDT